MSGNFIFSIFALQNIAIKILNHAANKLGDHWMW